MLKTVLFILGILISYQGIILAEADERLEDHNERTSYLIRLGDEQVKEINPETMDFLELMVKERERDKETEKDEENARE